MLYLAVFLATICLSCLMILTTYAEHQVVTDWAKYDNEIRALQKGANDRKKDPLSPLNTDLPQLNFEKGILVNLPSSVDYIHTLPRLSDDVIRMNPNGSCSPRAACSIPYMVNHVSPSFSRDYSFFDTQMLTDCLRNKRVLLLGDSTTGETFHDLAILLSNIGSRPVELDAYILNATIKSSKEHEMWTYHLPNGVDINFFCCRRNLTLEIPRANISIIYRFIGHHDLVKNDFGVKTLTSPEMREELHCMLGTKGSGACPTPDLILLNSGLHDRYHERSTYIDGLREALQMIKQQLDSQSGDKAKTR